jgi:hypothetical protein
MKQSEYKYFFLVLKIEGLPESISYRIPEHEYEELSETFCRNEGEYSDQPIVRFQTSTGLEIFVNLQYVLYVNFIWEPIKSLILDDEPANEDTGTIKFYLKHLEDPLIIYVGDPASFAEFVRELNSYKTLDRFRHFLDIDDEKVSINFAHFRLAETNTKFLNECEKAQLDKLLENKTIEGFEDETVEEEIMTTNRFPVFIISLVSTCC